MVTTRQAIMCVSRHLLEELMPDWQTVALLRYGELVEECSSELVRLSDSDKVAELAAPFHQVLKLPSDCWITGISAAHSFRRDEIAFRIASPDFVETPEMVTLPEVRDLNLVLQTADAHKLYERFGFAPLWNPERWLYKPRS